MKRLVFGGSFNPVHNGHVALLRALCDLVRPDVVTVVPSYLPVHKQVGNDYADGSHRLAMCKLAFEAPGVEISDMELRQKRPCYTVDTLTAIRREHPEDELYLACGSDMFLTFHEWRRYRRIYELAVICAVSRGDRLSEMAAYAHEQAKLGMRSLISEADPVVLSSTEIRQKIRLGQSVSALLPPRVWEYIAQNGLYREDS